MLVLYSQMAEAQQRETCAGRHSMAAKICEI
jgi:hypothetical protein